MTHVITRLCTREGACVEVCPVDCIIPGPKNDLAWGAFFYIDPDTCIDCGACIPVCPSKAIFTAEDVPADYETDIALNAAYFTEGPGYWDYDLDEQRGLRVREPGADVIYADFSFGPQARASGRLQPPKATVIKVKWQVKG